MLKLVICGLLFCLSGCVQPIHNMQSEFNAAEYGPYTKIGTGSIKGQAFLKRNDGQVVTCAGNMVVLMPATPYFNELVMATARGEDARSAMADTHILLKQNGIDGKLSKHTTCDAQGNFSFSKLPAAKWRILTEVQWLVRSTQGGNLVKQVETNPGSVTEVILTDVDLVRSSPNFSLIEFRD